MKLATFQSKGRTPRVGAVVEDATRIVDLQTAHQARYDCESPGLRSMQDLIEGGDAALDMAMSLERNPGSGLGAVQPAQDVRLLAPVPVPIQIRDCLCFEQHLVQAYMKAREIRAAQSPDPAAAMREMQEKKILDVPAVFYHRPLYYKANRFSVVGPDADVVWPDYSDMRDFELEFGFFVKGRAADIPKNDAAKHIFGYTIFNDFSARDEQVLEMSGQLGPAKGKDFDTGNAMGPWIVTADELRDPYNLTMVARVNGEEWGRGCSSTMYWKFEDLLSFVSRSETLYPGEFFGSGTVGNGCGLEMMRFLQPGDVVELEVEQIGILRNRIFGRPRSADKPANS
jgi:2-keto-4-pentenoate hydratase/2-oxohepta-3-ene-1,7-dioic acid hydratase in catechol pathway